MKKTPFATTFFAVDAVRSHLKPNPKNRGVAVVDIFRVENGAIVEHWDVMQPVPPQTANKNGVF
jgi:predicted SnoaL-like aldol condensation-catalyzing enzyme